MIENTPALNIPLEQVHLIEASAGTGKTWTLAALVVRLLLEGKRSCDQIIATTFTRAAAAEMRERIRARVDDTKRLIEKILLLAPKLKSPELTEVTDNAGAIFNHIKNELVSYPDYAKLLDDPLNTYIITYLLTEQFTQLNEKDPSKKLKKIGLDWARKQLELTLIQLDRMFVGTLDSLCQKILREFAFDLLLEQGQGKPLALTESNDNTTHDLIHDAIRIWRTEQHANNPQLMTLLAESNKLKDIDNLTKQVNKATNFIAESLLPTNTVVMKLDKVDSLINQLKRADDTELMQFLNPDGMYHKNLYGGRALKNNGKNWHLLKLKLIQHTSSFYAYCGIHSSEYKLLEGIAYKTETNFSSKNKDKQAIFDALPIVTLLYKIAEELNNIAQAVDALTEHRNYFVCRYVRENLPKVLEDQGKTTFALQLRQLNGALEKDTEKSLAKQIRYRYPVALIDEFQDVNADQAGMIYHIYQEGEKGKLLDEKILKRGCLLLVGDPKQSIYGFRGGDIHNYQKIKKTIPPKHHHTLDTNRRSQATLINSLNHLFGAKQDFLEEVTYQPVKPFGVEAVLLDAEGKALEGLLRHIAVSEQKSLTDDNAKLTTVTVLAQKIAELLATHKLKTKNGNIRALQADDIAVLFKSRYNVMGLDKQLQQHGIATFKGADDSVFSGQMASDIASIMSAMLNPHHLGTVHLALVSLVFGFNQQDLELLANDHATKPKHWHVDLPSYDFASLQFAFSEAGKTWQKFGFLAGWQALADEFQLWQRLADHKDGERYLIDIRHLLEIIQTQAINANRMLQGHLQQIQEDNKLQEQSLFTWFLQQLNEQPTDDWALERRLPSASGVQVMSIHKSKGLEFPVVFVVGVDSNTKQAKKLDDIFLTVNEATNEICLTAEAGSDNENIKADNARRKAEDIRVTYVAFTRPSQILYVVTNDTLENSVTKTTQAKGFEIKQNPLSHWLINEGDYQQQVARAFTQDYVDLSMNIKISDNPIESDLSDSQEDSAPLSKPRQTHFKTWRATSFSALARDLHNDHTDKTNNDSQVTNETDYVMEGLLEENQYADVMVDEAKANSIMHLDAINVNPIRFQFPRGANPGSFLHKVFEKLDFTHADSWQWLIPSIAEQFGIANEFSRYGNVFDEQSQTAVQTWIKEVLYTPLSSGVRLVDISQNQRLPEMSFNLGLGANFSTAELTDYLKHANFDMVLPPQTKLFRFLKGEIDLVYEHHGKYFVLDYKSNHLGDALENYNQDAMADAMNHAGYWLQATIYMLALHRYLKVRLPNYAPETHLGGVEYAFIRGMHPNSIEQTDGKSLATGVISWYPTAEFMMGLDEVFKK